MDNVLVSISHFPYNNSTLQELSLPASLEALDRHVGLPPSLLRKAEEVQLEDGLARVDQSIENVENFSQYCKDLLDQVILFIPNLVSLSLLK